MTIVVIILLVRRVEHMHKVDIIYDIGLDFLFEGKKNENNNKIPDSGKNVKISDKTFDLMLKEGLIKKTDDGYVFVGKYKDTVEFKKK